MVRLTRVMYTHAVARECGGWIWWHVMGAIYSSYIWYLLNWKKTRIINIPFASSLPPVIKRMKDLSIHLSIFIGCIWIVLSQKHGSWQTLPTNRSRLQSIDNQKYRSFRIKKNLLKGHYLLLLDITEWGLVRIYTIENNNSEILIKKWKYWNDVPFPHPRICSWIRPLLSSRDTHNNVSAWKYYIFVIYVNIILPWFQQPYSKLICYSRLQLYVTHALMVRFKEMSKQLFFIAEFIEEEMKKLSEETINLES